MANWPQWSSDATVNPFSNLVTRVFEWGLNFDFPPVGERPSTGRESGVLNRPLGSFCVVQYNLDTLLKNKSVRSNRWRGNTWCNYKNCWLNHSTINISHRSFSSTTAYDGLKNVQRIILDMSLTYFRQDEVSYGPNGQQISLWTCSHAVTEFTAPSEISADALRLHYSQ